MQCRSINRVNSNNYYNYEEITNDKFVEKTIRNATFSYCIMTCGTEITFIDCVFENCTYVGENDAYLTDVYHNKLCEGDIIGYKIVLSIPHRWSGHSKLIIKLLIPKEAKRSHVFTNKCRAEYAKVLEIYDMNGKISKNRIGYSLHDIGFTYRKGRTVKPKEPYCDDIKECASGIHFFRTFKEAVDYNI